jgi:hypothetical protein
VDERAVSGQPGAGREPLGSAREEAARLVEALSTWAAGAVGSPGSAFDRERLHAEGIATGAPQCRLCPVCSAISALRGVRPEVVEHLLDAGGSLLAALRAGLEAPSHPTPGSPDGGPAGPGRVERIDIG